MGEMEIFKGGALSRHLHIMATTSEITGLHKLGQGKERLGNLVGQVNLGEERGQKVVKVKSLLLLSNEWNEDGREGKKRLRGSGLCGEVG